jgi:hypothetical protein
MITLSYSYISYFREIFIVAQMLIAISLDCIAFSNAVKIALREAAGDRFGQNGKHDNLILTFGIHQLVL